MARNSTGTHSNVSGIPVTAGTAVSSTVMNNELADLSAEITDSLSRSGKGGMSAPLPLVAGTVSAPAMFFPNDPDSGFYWISANKIGLALGGVKVAEFDAAPAEGGATLAAVSPLASRAGISGTGGAGGHGVLGLGTGAGNGGQFTGGTTGECGVMGLGNGTSGAGVVGLGNGTGIGVVGVGVNGYGVLAESDTSSPVCAAFRIVPQDAAPSGACLVGDIYVTTAGVLMICTGAGTGAGATWTKVGVQS